jgi:hypothetical protein
MRPSLLVIGVVALSAALIANACSGVCTAVGCQPGFSAKVHRADESFPSGTHQIDVVADGVSLSCTFTFPLPTVAGGGTSEPSCPSGMTVSVLPATSCTETTNGNTTAQTCTDIPGQFVEWITLMGTPAEVQVQQSVDGALILDAMVAPTYQEVAPNDPQCGPICQEAFGRLDAAVGRDTDIKTTPTLAAAIDAGGTK